MGHLGSMSWEAGVGQDGNDGSSFGDKSSNNSGSQRHFLWSQQDEGGASVNLALLAWGSRAEKQAFFGRSRGQLLPERQEGGS